MLIKCPDCGKMFSEFAEYCPECGCPIEDAKTTNNPTTPLQLQDVECKAQEDTTNDNNEAPNSASSVSDFPKEDIKDGKPTDLNNDSEETNGFTKYIGYTLAVLIIGLLIILAQHDKHDTTENESIEVVCEVVDDEAQQKEGQILERANYIFKNIPDHRDLEKVDKTVFTPSFLDVLEKAFALDRELKEKGDLSMETVAYWYFGQDGNPDDGLRDISVISYDDNTAYVKVEFKNFEVKKHRMKLVYSDEQWYCDNWDEKKQDLQECVEDVTKNIHTEHCHMEGEIVNEYDDELPCELDYDKIIKFNNVHKVSNVIFKDLSQGGIKISMEGEASDEGQRTLRFWGNNGGVTYKIQMSEMRRDAGNYFGSIIIDNKQLSIRLWIR